MCDAPVAQLDRVSGYEPGGREFESLRARKLKAYHYYTFYTLVTFLIMIVKLLPLCACSSAG